MGMVAEHTLRLKFKDYKAETNAIDAVRNYIEKSEKDGTAVFHIKECAKAGVTPDTLDGITKMLLAYEQEGGVKYYKWRGFLCFRNCFHSSYGWASVIDDAFSLMAPYLEDGSAYILYGDEGIEKSIVKNGTVVYQ